MKVETKAPTRIVLYEGDGALALDPARRYEILKALLAKGHRATLVTRGGKVAPPQGDMIVLGEFESGQAPFGETDSGARVHAADIAGRSPEEILAAVERLLSQSEIPAPGAWKPWFPVIDFDRCTNCMQCLSFCLFDVYGVDAEKRITVANPDKCKTNCPACSRVCPEVAILFPKYRGGPINGDIVNAEDVNREKMKIDVSALLGGDIYAMLRDRHARAQSRFSKERDEDKALKERMKCLVQIGQQMDIPPEVLMALPSLDQIQRKAAEKSAEAAIILKERGES